MVEAELLRLSWESFECLIGAVLRAFCVCTDAYGCQGCHPNVNMLRKPVMDDQELGKSAAALKLFGVLSSNMHMCLCVCCIASVRS